MSFSRRYVGGLCVRPDAAVMRSLAGLSCRNPNPASVNSLCSPIGSASLPGSVWVVTHDSVLSKSSWLWR